MARSNGGNGGSYFDLAIQVVATSDASYTLRAVVYLTSLNVIDSSNNLSVGGNWSRSGTLALNGVYNGTPVWFADITVNRQYGSAVGVTVNASWSGVEYWGATLSASESYSVPARPWQVPATPGTPSVARVSDTQHTISWSRSATSTAPYDGQRVQRLTEGGSWVTIATVSGTATSYSDRTTVADRDYRWRVQAYNSSGTGTSGASGHVQTTPKAPTNVTATKNASNGVVVSWTNASTLTPITWRVERSSNGGAWTALTTAQAQGTTSYTDAAPDPGQLHKYRVRAQSTEGATTNSAFVESGTVQLAAPPNAPTNLGPQGARPADELVSLSWAHNPVDSAPQSKRQVRWRVQSSATWTDGSEVASSAQGATLTPSTDAGATNGQTLEWAVRTWGQHADPSPWSATATIPLSARPTTTINVPDGTLDRSQVTVEWGFYDEESSPQTAWEVRLLDAGRTAVETKTGAGAATSVTLDTVVPDGSSWFVQARTQDSAGLWSDYHETSFTVAYALPPTPVLLAQWFAQDATVSLSVEVPAPTGGEVPAEFVDVYRSIDGAPWQKIAQGVPPGAVVTDYSPTVDGENAYYAVAVSALPSSAQSATVTVTTPQAGDPPAALWLSGGPGFSQGCRAMSNVAITTKSGKATKVLHRFAGRDKRVEFSSEATERSWGVSFDLIRDPWLGESSAQEWLDLADLAGPHLLRTPDHYRVVSISDVTVNRGIGGVVTGVSFSAEECDVD